MSRGQSITVLEGDPRLARYQRDPSFRVEKTKSRQVKGTGQPAGKVEAAAALLLSLVKRFGQVVGELKPPERAALSELVRARPAIGEAIERIMGQLDPEYAAAVARCDAEPAAAETFDAAVDELLENAPEGDGGGDSEGDEGQAGETAEQPEAAPAASTDEPSAPSGADLGGDEEPEVARKPRQKKGA